MEVDNNEINFNNNIYYNDDKEDISNNFTNINKDIEENENLNIDNKENSIDLMKIKKNKK